MSKKMIEIICPFCNEQTMKYASEVKRQIKNNRKIYCSKQCSLNGSKLSKLKYKKYNKICPMCAKEFITSDAKKSPKFCCSICATNYSRTFVDKTKISNSVKAAWIRGDFDNLKSKLKINGMHNLKCAICSKNFKNKNKNKTCSKECYLKLLSTQSRDNPNCGGETNYKKYIYKDVYMDSSWEVNLAKFLDLNNIVWERSRKIVFLWTDRNNKKRRYYPDFYLPKYNLYLDPKNKFLLEKDEFKINQVIKENNIDLICESLDNIIIKLKNKIFKGL
jgi:hypothetical protein